MRWIKFLCKLFWLPLAVAAFLVTIGSTVYFLGGIGVGLLLGRFVLLLLTISGWDIAEENAWFE